MVNDADPIESNAMPGLRGRAAHAPVLIGADAGAAIDLAAVQAVGTRLVKALVPIVAPMLRDLAGGWAAPVQVMRLGAYRAARGGTPTAWQPLGIAGSHSPMLIVLDAARVLQMLDGFFGGEGAAPASVPATLSPAAEALVARLAAQLAPAIAAAWAPVATIALAPVADAAIDAPALDDDEAVIVAPLCLAGASGIAGDPEAPTDGAGAGSGADAAMTIDLIYPLRAVRAPLTREAAGPRGAAAPAWRAGLTRAAMDVTFPVRAVLAEPVVPLARLLDLRAGDVLPIDFGPEVPVTVADRRLGWGVAGTAHGRAAVRLTLLEPLSEEDLR